MRSDRKQTFIFIIILLILSMGIGYAYLTTTLSIDGISDIDSASWDVHWANVQVKSGSVSESQVTQAATISANGTTVSYHINLKNPGEYYEFTVDAVNAGSLNAMIESIHLTEDGNEISIGDTPSYLIQTICYDEDDAEILPNQLLESGATEKYRFRLEYKTDLGEEDIHDDISIDYSFSVNYVQADSNAVRVRYYGYTTSSTSCTIGSPPPEAISGHIFDNPEDASSDFEMFYMDILLRHKIVNGIIKESEIGFYHGSGENYRLYYVKGGDGGTSFEANQAVLNSVFGADNCSYDSKKPSRYKCNLSSKGNWGQMELPYAEPDGTVHIYLGNSCECYINSDGSSFCYAEGLY